jgi:hypothetical protein
LKRIEQILTNCIEDIRSGKATVDECLARYPEMRQELEPLLKTALSIKSPAAYRLEAGYKQSARANLLRQIRPVKQQRRMSFADIISLGIPRQLAGVRAAVATLAVMIVISMVGSGTAYASQSSVPGDILYPVKIGTENVRLLAAGDAKAKAQLNIRFASKRLEELSKIVNRDEEDSKAVVQRYRRHLEAATTQLAQSGITPDFTSRLEDTITEMQSQVYKCDDLIGTNPVNIVTVYEAATQAVDSEVKVLQILAQIDILKAAEINTGMMQNRLQKAVSTAEFANFRNMEQQLFQYQQLNQMGRQLLEWAQNTNNQVEPVEKICLQQLNTDLAAIEVLSRQVPEEYQSTINECENMINQFQHRARYGQINQGYPEVSPGGYSGGQDGDSTSGTGNTNPTQSPDNTNTPVNETTIPATVPAGGSEGNGESGDPGGMGDGGVSGNGYSDNGSGGKPW